MENVFVSEVFGTFMLVLLGDGVVANVLLNESKGKDSGWMVISTGWGLAVFVGVIVAGPFSGAHINPAVTLGLAASGAELPASVFTYIAGEMTGAFLGAVVVWITYLSHWRVTDDPGLKLAVFSTGPAIRKPFNNFITEVVGTFVLVFVVIAFGVQAGDPTAATPMGLASLGALPVALLVWGIGLSLGGPTGYAINPARDLGPRIAHQVLPIAGKGSSDWAYSWIPVLGPITGGVIAGLLATAVF
ncbi:MAG: aquaporin [Actinobacteria bacterium]|nr:aquaporin [Actinomycetota bacterium]